MACCYSGCYNTRKKNPDLTFFRFPKERERCYSWLKKCDNSSIHKLSFSELQYRVVCEEHFSSKCFDVSRLTSGKTRRSLFKFACPQPSSVIAALKKEEEQNESYRPTALMEAPPFPSRLQRDAKVLDLASPKLLMSMTENICPMIRPISPNTVDNYEEEGHLTPIFVSSLSSQVLPPLSPLLEKPSDPSSSATNPSAKILEVKRKLPKSLTTKLLKRKKRKKYKHCNNSAVKLHSVEESKQTSSLVPERVEEISEGGCTTSSPCPRRYKKILPKTEKISVEDLEEETDTSSAKHHKLHLQNLKVNLRNNKLNLDHNSLEILPNIDKYESLTELSLENNKIHNLIWFLNMTNLKVLKLANNCLISVEALAKLTSLTYVDLSGNKISSLLRFKPKSENSLEYLNLSNNQITEIACLTNLVHLKELLLHENNISSIKYWSKLLPYSIKNLTLAKNYISNLQDFSELRHLEFLESLTVYNNPCLRELITGSTMIPLGPKSFNYVPYILFWCPNLIFINDIVVHPADSLKAKQLIEDGRIGTFKSEDTDKLIAYLSDMCAAPKVVPLQDNIVVNSSHASSSVNSSIVAYLITPQNTQSAKFHGNFEDNEVNTHLPDFRHKEKKDKSTNDCTFSSCSHYIELIEEKARCHKLQRTNEEYYDRIQLLEATLIQNGISLSDVEIKMEEEDDEEL